MNQRQIEYFLDVYKTHSIKKSAENFYITQQAMSKAIIGFEKELGHQLFARNGKNLIPTSEADCIHQHVQNIAYEYSVIKNKKYLPTYDKIKLTITTSHDVLQYLSIDFISAFQREYPNIVLYITESSDQIGIERLKNEEVELAILSGPLSISTFDSYFLYSCNYYAIINRQNPLSSYDVFHYTDLRDEPIALQGGSEYSPYSIYYKAYENEGVTPHIILETSNYYPILQAAISNIAVGIALDYFTENAPLDKVKIIPFAESCFTSLYLVSNNFHCLSKEAKQFKNFLLNWVRY